MKKALALFLVLAMVLAMMPIVSIPASAAEAVEYLSPIYVDINDTTKGICGWETKTVTDYTLVTKRDGVWSTGWYVAEGDIYIGGEAAGIECRGDVKLILKDGCRLEIHSFDDNDTAIQVQGNNSLTIYAQSSDVNTMGVLIATSEKYAAGIGGGGEGNKAGGNITINGGTIEAYGGRYAAGIGGGKDASGSNITINGGNVYAEGSSGGAGIGGGIEGKGHNIYIFGGTVCAKGGYNGAGIGGGDDDGNASDIYISGGNVTAYGRGGGAGIGGGNDKGTLESIYISGGMVFAKCGTDGSDANGGAGIGGGDQGSAQYISITGGIVTAHAGYEAAGIGGGRNADCDEVNISYATVYAYGSKCSGIGRGYKGGCTTVRITSSEVTAKSSGDAENHAIGVNGNYNGGIYVSSDCSIYTGAEKRFLMYGADGSSIINNIYGDPELYINCPVVRAVNPADNTEARYYTFEEYTKACSGSNLYLLKDVAISQLNLPKEGVTYTLYSHGHTLYDKDGNVLLEKGGLILEKGGPFKLESRPNQITYFQDGTDKTIGATRITPDITYWSYGAYYAEGKIEINETITVTGEIQLILCDGCELTINGINNSAGICVTGDNSLTIYCQSEGTGKLVVTGGENGAGIGGNNCQSGENITIYGGCITATGGNYGAGIGGGNGRQGKNITIYGGTVNATGGYQGAGIGGGGNHIAENIAIYGGNVTAIGGRYAAGIGGGYSPDNKTVSNITIFGGIVKATSTSTGDDLCGGAGIGGGSNQHADTISISGGEVTATAGLFAAGIGGGTWGNGTNIKISDGTVNATGGYQGAGIGGGYGAIAKNVTISNSTVTATGGQYAAGIGGGYSPDNNKTVSNITISGGIVKATSTSTINDLCGGAGIGGGSNQHADIISISGGEVTATAGLFAAGIGGGTCGNGTNIEINDGTVNATGGYQGSGIGGGYGGNGDRIYITGGEIHATGDNASSIGGGKNGNTCSIYLASDMMATSSDGKATVTGNGLVRPMETSFFNTYSAITIKAIGKNLASVFADRSVWFIIGGGVVLLAAVAAVIVVANKKKQKTNA